MSTSSTESYQEYIEGYEMRPAISHFEHLGLPGIANALKGTMIEDGKLATLHNKISQLQIMLNPVNRFIVYIDAISQNIFSDEIKYTDINDMIEQVSKVPKIEYKNPIAYILGYVASRNKKNGQLNKSQVDKAIKLISNVEKNIVHPPDVIRYANLWLYLESPLLI
jgi:hypothetical protein